MTAYNSKIGKERVSVGDRETAEHCFSKYHHKVHQMRIGIFCVTILLVFLLEAMDSKRSKLETPEKHTDSQSTDFSAEVVNLSRESSFPSPLHMNAGFLSFPTGAEDKPTFHPPQLYETLEMIISQLQVNDIKLLSKVSRLKLFSLLGQCLQSEIKKEAEHYRHPDVRDNIPVSTKSSETIQLYEIEELLVFFESCTGKSGRVNNAKTQEKVAAIQSAFYESVLKGANLNSIGPYQLQKIQKVRNQVQSKAIHDPLGASYSFCQKQSVDLEPIQMKYSGVLISDNAQKGASKFQKHAFGKLDRSTPVQVSTHNIRAISCEQTRENDNEIFKDLDVMPSENEFHALFRPVNSEFIDVVLDRQEQAAKKGRQSVRKVLANWLDELIKDREVGIGKTSIEKVCEKMDYGTSDRIVVCIKCHNQQIYQVDTKNICVRCHNNPTYYERNEDGPYKCYKFKEGVANTVRIEEQQPLNLNPSGYKNLFKLHQNLKQEYWPSDFLAFPFYGDGLPCISYDRMKMDCIQCVTHDVHIQLNNKDLLEDHCKPTCSWDWPLKDLYTINGESHEEIAMLVVALSASINFGLMEMLEDLGRHTRASQMQAIKTKNLHTLFEINYIFTKGSMMACMVPFLNHCSENQIGPDISGLYQYVSESKNMKYQARFRALVDLNMPCFVKRLGIRLNNPDIAQGASGLFFPISFAFKQTFYRDYYHTLFLNGVFSDVQEKIKPAGMDLGQFVSEEAMKAPPKVANYREKHPMQNIKFGFFKSRYSYLTEGPHSDSHEGGDFVQENQLGRVMPFLTAGQIFNTAVFANAARKCQIYSDSKRAEGIVGTERKSPRPKFEAEVQSLSALVLAKNELPEIECGLEDLHEDVLNLKGVGFANYKKFFESRIKAIPTSQIPLKPAFLTKNAHTEFHRIENQTKAQIVVKIQQMITSTEFSDELEKSYFISRAGSKSIKKSELLDLYNDLFQMCALSY